MEIVGAFACSHAGLIVARRDRAPAAQRERIFGAYQAVREEIARLRPDALLVVATDHLQAFPLAAVPAFAVGVGPVATGLGDGGLPPCSVPVHQGLAQAILYGCMAARRRAGLLREGLDRPLVRHAALTAYTPPRHPDRARRPELQRAAASHRFGAAACSGRSIRESVLGGPDGRAVVIGTGGLSHWVGSPARRAFMNRAAGTRLAELAEHPVVLDETGEINQEFDRLVPRPGCRRTARRVRRRMDPRARRGGRRQRRPGAAQLDHDARRSWRMRARRVLAYEPVAEWLTGTAVVRFEV